MYAIPFSVVPFAQNHDATSLRGIVGRALKRVEDYIVWYEEAQSEVDDLGLEADNPDNYVFRDRLKV